MVYEQWTRAQRGRVKGEGAGSYTCAGKRSTGAFGVLLVRDFSEHRFNIVEQSLRML